MELPPERAEDLAQVKSSARKEEICGRQLGRISDNALKHGSLSFDSQTQNV
jgi:hypothetical protein